MERGLLWLPLLIVFFGLAWAGWYEYQRVEAYRRWATAFERAKYDVRAVLGQQGPQVTWGRPTRGEPAHLETFSLQDVRAIGLRAGDPTATEPIAILFELPDRTLEIPFTDARLATRWQEALEAQRQQWQQPAGP